MAVTIKDVAKETNLAISTISKYMNGGTVRLENRVLIEAAVQKLGYSPNRSARGLRTSKTYMIGLVTGQVNSPHTAAIVSGIAKRFRNLGYSVIFATYEENGVQIEDYLDYLLERGVDGIISSPIAAGEDCLKKAVDQNVPVLVVEENSGEMQTDCVQVDCCGGVYQSVEHLIESGHQRIAIIKGPEHKLTAQERLRGYYRVMEDYGYPVRQEYLIPGDFTYQSGYKGIMKLWELEEKPTAVFVSNYDMCLGAMAAVHNLDIRVPEALSVVSFDDFELSVMVRPRLTTVRQPLEEMANAACDLLYRRIQGDYSDFPKKIRLKTQCIYRDSVKTYSRGGGNDIF